MISIIRTNSENLDFQALVHQLDAYLAITDGEEHGFYHQFNGIDKLKEVVVAYQNNQAVGCGAIKPIDENAMEVKRMFVLPEVRGKGIATLVLQELENWTKELSFQKCMLETGVRQPDAIRLYQKNGYQIIANYGQYAGIENSICFEKTL